MINLPLLRRGPIGRDVRARAARIPSVPAPRVADPTPPPGPLTTSPQMAETPVREFAASSPPRAPARFLHLPPPGLERRTTSLMCSRSAAKTLPLHTQPQYCRRTLYSTAARRSPTAP